MDDTDVWGCIKVWAKHPDKLLSSISQMLLDRKLYKIILLDEPISDSFLEKIQIDLLSQENVYPEDIPYLMVQGHITNAAYLSEKQSINILTKDKKVKDIAEASDLPTIKALSNIVKKYYICWAKNVYLQTK
jgi:hypothetical protein